MDGDLERCSKSKNKQLKINLYKDIVKKKAYENKV